MKSVAGENTDLVINGEKIHVQTEDWGENGHVLVSRIFKNGSVLKHLNSPMKKLNSPKLKRKDDMLCNSCINT